jgi:hypothetical protein
MAVNGQVQNFTNFHEKKFNPYNVCNAPIKTTRVNWCNSWQKTQKNFACGNLS